MGDSVPQWMQDFTSGWPMIRANLPTFFVILVLMIGTVWVVLASKNGQLELQDRQLADYRDKLKGATPEEAKAKIDAPERTLPRLNKTYDQHPIAKVILDAACNRHPRHIAMWGVGLTDSDADLIDLYSA
jgi:hypothetical protein